MPTVLKKKPVSRVRYALKSSPAACPYCQREGRPVLMWARPEGYFLCGSCGHVSNPDTPLICRCPQCQLNRMA